MTTLMPGEDEALDRAGVLLKFAAENKEVPKEIVATICSSWSARRDNAWNADIATRFWMAFNSLCSLIRPVTIDTLSTNLREIPQPRWRWWAKGQAGLSLSRRSAARYLFLLILLLILAVSFGFLASAENKLSSDIRGLLASGAELIEKIDSESAELGTEIGDEDDFSKVAASHQKAIAQIQSQLQQEYFLVDQIYQKTKLMVKIASYGTRTFDYTKGDLNTAPNLTIIKGAIHDFYQTRQEVNFELLQESVNSDIIGVSIMPLLLGLMGACTYVVRTISEQIKESTFSTTSPIRHIVRVALGGLTGVVIGFGGFSVVNGLSASALAFLAGYAVEPVFATFDKIAEKFK